MLQKEREKADRKKEKKNGKKSFHQGGGETSKHSKRTHKKRRHEDISLADLESRRASKESAEQLENSGLSEEHGAPCFIQTAAHGSPESSQDSSKRRKVILPSPSQNKNGNILRIKIKRDQEFPAATLNNSRVQQMVRGPSPLSKQIAVRPHHREVIVKSEATAAVLKQVDVQPPPVKILQRVESSTTSNVVPKVDPVIAPKIMKQIDPWLSLEAATVRLEPTPSKVIGSAGTLPTKLSPAAQVFQRVDPPVPSIGLQRDAPSSSAMVLQKETSPVAFRQPDVQLPFLPQQSDVPIETLIKQQQPNTSLPIEEPSFSGRKTDKGAVPEIKQSKSDRKKNRKAEKKERKFGDLFVTWNPPSFEMEDTGDGDQDWLLGSARKPDASVSCCTASDGSVPFQSVSQQFSLQPRAIHLPDLHVYQMPYVVPF
ncbi:hypothetical protein BRADI_1g68500v3 [Brachypodium distachyon]|uniref:Uncharacterized protein n=1 Tax=Brachypodium distachyon TaxID=15368 RepID=A0A0Q3HIH4_BRADI|nr:hypothetical protein BRADI_1g68500v3 [Brachypodium distachyon]